MSDTASGAAAVAPRAAFNDASTSRQPVLQVLPSEWDDVPTGRVPASVIRYFEEANAREEARRLRRHARPIE
jgi:hypothetical protein